jgi:hypothetical protein
MKRRAVAQTFCCDAVIEIPGCLTTEEFYPVGKFPNPARDACHRTAVASHCCCAINVVPFAILKQQSEQPVHMAGRPNVSG